MLMAPITLKKYSRASAQTRPANFSEKGRSAGGGLKNGELFTK